MYTENDSLQIEKQYEIIYVYAVCTARQRSAERAVKDTFCLPCGCGKYSDLG